MRRALFAVVVLAILLVQSAARAQEPTPVTPPPVPPDTTPAPGDSAQQRAVVQDSVYPVTLIAEHAFGTALGLSDGVWEWDTAALLLEGNTTLQDFLERIPGVTNIRTGLAVQPEAAAAFGGTANRLEVFLDGFQLDPLSESSFDVSKLELVHIAHLRIERRIGLIRIFVRTIAATDSRPHTRIEAGIGEPETNLFRGLLLTPKLFFGPFGVAIDRTDTDGFRRDEPADQFAGWVKWAYLRGKSGLQVQYRRASTDRDENVPWDAEHTRDDVIAQLRLNITDVVVAELFGGQSTFEADTADPSAAEDSLPKIDLTSLQFGGLLSVATPFAWARGGVRFRDNESLPAMQIDASGGIRLGNAVTVSADVTQADWRDAGSALWYSVQGSLAPFALLRVFGEYTAGKRGAPYLYGIDSTRAFINEHTGYRVGGELSWGGFRLGGAWLHVESDSNSVFGLPFDTVAQRTFGAIDANGWELSASVPLFLRGLTGYGMVTNWMDGSLGVYMPQRQIRAGLQLNVSPMRSGSLDLYGRAEIVQRGEMFVPDGTLPENTTLDAYVQIRIIDVRLFGRFEDITGTNALEVLGRPILGPRIFYGVKWQFWN